MIRGLIGVTVVVLAAVIVWALLVPGSDWLARHDVGSARGPLLQTARDAARGRLLTLGAGLLAAGALLFTARNFALSREGQVTDRYTKAIEQLGSDKLDVRIGGIYALERIARDSAKDHPTVMEVLAAFIREHSREPWPLPDPRDPEQQRLTRPDVQAAVTVVGRRDAKRDIEPIDLSGADLIRVNLTGPLSGANFIFANFIFANLSGANLTAAKLSNADLSHADFTGANLTGAELMTSLSGATLTRANLTDARLIYADLSGASLSNANLTRANLSKANLTAALLDGANVEGANLIDANLLFATLTAADLTAANLSGANLSGANLTEARWPTAEPVPEGWIVDSDSGRLKRAGQLSEVMTHYL